MSPLDDVTRAYVAGLFDGEGCVAFRMVRQRGGLYGQLVVQITQRRPEVLHWLKETFGFGYILVKAHGPTRLRPGTRKCYDWRASSASARKFLAEIRPFLRIKGDEVDSMLELDRAAVTPRKVA